VVVGVVGIVVYSEMCGRVAAVSGRAVFDAVRERLGFNVGLVALIGAQLVSFMTLAAEIGGIAVVLQLLSGLSYGALLVLAVVGLFVVLWTMPFDWIERFFGYLGLCLLVFAVAAVKLHPDWGRVGHGFVPSVDTSGFWVWGFYVVGLLAAAMTPYEVYFYSSGAVEERWTPKELGLNKANAIIGYGLGGFLSFAIMIGAGAYLLPAGVDPETLGSTALVAQAPLGQIGLVLALVGMLFAIGGAAVDAAFSGAYNLAQFLGWEWGKYRRPSGAPRFTIAWLVMMAMAFVIVSTGVDPVLVTEYSVVLSVVALPFTYLPVLLVARDPAFMGEHVNGRFASALGWFYLVIITLVAFAAIPLMLATNGGSPT
jgi:Mn2+/Fe2+ NRAMP family transporter